jgi:hypothetical protein
MVAYASHAKSITNSAVSILNNGYVRFRNKLGLIIFVIITTCYMKGNRNCKREHVKQMTADKMG